MRVIVDVCVHKFRMDTATLRVALSTLRVTMIDAASEGERSCRELLTV